MLDGHRYKGRHRQPSTAGRTTARVVAAGVVAVSPLLVAGYAQADTLDAIEQCESGGTNAKNPSSSASGYYQIVDGTWAAYGGLEFAPTARQATKAEQETVARRILAAAGTAPWNASKSCWSGKTAAKHSTAETVKAAAPASTAPKPKPAPTAKHRAVEPVAVVRSTAGPGPADRPTAGGTGGYVVKSGDTLTGIALANHVAGGWQALAANNTDIVEDPHWIFVGERLKV